MRIVSFKDEDFAQFCRTMNRRAVPDAAVAEAVAGIVRQVRERGDAAVLELTERFDGVRLEGTLLQGEPPRPQRALATALKMARRNVADFARRTVPKNWSAKNAQGAVVGERFLPFDRVGIYVPGGSAPLISTAIMTVTLASVARCREIVVATPPPVHAALHYAIRLAGATEIHQMGGAQAVAALALGTQSIRPVEKIFGPGNRFVTEAKRQLVGAVAIDQLPGPSEVLVLADETADAACVAADLLAQAEHGTDSQAVLLTPRKAVRDAVEKHIRAQLGSLARRDILERSLAAGCVLVHTRDMQQAVELANAYAAEHVSLQVRDAGKILPQIRAAGAIFVGRFSPVAAGDFLAGPSHTLPTGGAAKSFSGLTVDQFFRRSSIIRYSEAALAKSRKAIREIALAEQLDAHANSVDARFVGEPVKIGRKSLR